MVSICEVCCKLQDPIEIAVPASGSPLLKSSILLTLKDIFRAHRTFMSSASAETIFCKLFTTTHVAKELARKLES